MNIAIIVMRNSDGAVICYVGSGDQTNESRQGHVDLVRSIRSPGSALKPFIYAMAFEKLLVHPDTIVADQPIDIAGYRPANADGEYAGDISIRQALLLSKNTVPVLLMDKIGVPAFLARFRTVGSPLRLGASDSEAGLAVALGGVGVSLEQLVWMFSAFANEGELKRLRFATTDPEVTLGDLFEPAAANAVADILADVPPPAGRPRLEARDGSRRVGFKTGTSYGFRDAWTVGFGQVAYRRRVDRQAGWRPFAWRLWRDGCGASGYARLRGASGAGYRSRRRKKATWRPRQPARLAPTSSQIWAAAGLSGIVNRSD
ncbi:penicillin-binding transpeptidase domain-containing protein [Mesorhizobium sp. C120A]|uniref:penicillin-binding transpeptidase domain-containing protein n=1 Tax=Mesorhizobium sp. C120A TaxID=2956824 RepID=UPI0025788781|nr:penicillin-binding transpeptidase domain-containing protein [Mesorhizobium sp. C120A]WJI42187.1 penicillin-binding transpeptidase domain-containing protein [Mesorhizobium sp. C120A]